MLVRARSSVVVSLILIHCLCGTTIAQAITQSTPATPTANQEQAGKIDQVLKECSTLQTNGPFDQLERRATEALKLSRDSGDQLRTARSLSYLGAAEYYEGRLQDALDHHHQAGDLALAAGNKRFYAVALQNMGATLSAMGRYEEALFYLNKTLEISKEINDRRSTWAPIKNMGDLHGRLGDFEKAEAVLQEALALAREFKNQLAEEASLLSLVGLRVATKRYQEALEYCDKAAEIDGVVKHQGLHYELLGNKANVHQELGDYQKAIDLYEEAEKLAHATGFTQEEAIIISNIGVNQRALGRLDQALASQLRAKEKLGQYSAFTYPDILANLDWRIALDQADLGHKAEAWASFENAIKDVERIRSSAVPTETARASISASRRKLFTDAIEFLIKQKREQDAFDVAERFRARAFLDLLADSRIDLERDLTPAQRQQKSGIFNRISAVQKELLTQGVTPDRQAELKSQLSQAENDLDAWQLAVRRDNPRYANLRHPEPVAMAKLRNGFLDPHTVLVEYLLGEKNSYAWVVSQQKQSLVTLPAQKEIQELVGKYRETLTRRVSALSLKRHLTDFEILSRKAYDAVIRPLEDSLGDNRQMLIVADGALQYLPFETITISAAHQSANTQSRHNQPEELLLNRFAISYIPSASALVAIKSRKRESTRPSKTLVAFGDPLYERSSPASAAESSTTRSFTVAGYRERGFDFIQLPNTREEVLGIAGLYQPRERDVYLGADAREELVKKTSLDQYRYLHFATHAMIDDRVPARSGIVLSLSDESKEDGILQMSEIMQLKLGADLVTLSACSTGLGRLFEGEGVVGLTRSFLYAGADSVVVSLWNVNDIATAELMKNFYANLNRGFSKEEALNRAKLSLLKGRRLEWRHPYFWAPFVLVGNP